MLIVFQIQVRCFPSFRAAYCFKKIQTFYWLWTGLYTLICHGITLLPYHSWDNRALLQELVPCHSRSVIKTIHWHGHSYHKILEFIQLETSVMHIVSQIQARWFPWFRAPSCLVSKSAWICSLASSLYSEYDFLITLICRRITWLTNHSRGTRARLSAIRPLQLQVSHQIPKLTRLWLP